MSDDLQKINQQSVEEKEEGERLKRILILYEEIGKELDRLKTEGTGLCNELRGVIDHEKLTLIKQKINKYKN